MGNASTCGATKDMSVSAFWYASAASSALGPGLLGGEPLSGAAHWSNCVWPRRCTATQCKATLFDRI